LEDRLGDEYSEFESILSDYLADYIRVETNPAITINAIYNQITQFASVVADYLSERIQNMNIEDVTSALSKLAAMNGGVDSESK